MKKLLLLFTFLFLFSGIAPQVYSSENIINKYSDVIDGGRCQATTKKGTQCKRNAAQGSNYCWQHGGSTKSNNDKSYKKDESTKTDVSTTSTGETYKGKTVYTGPRGGKYYINKNGNKTYIKRRR